MVPRCAYDMILDYLCGYGMWNLSDEMLGKTPRRRHFSAACTVRLRAPRPTADADAAGHRDAASPYPITHAVVIQSTNSIANMAAEAPRVYERHASSIGLQRGGGRVA